MEDFTVDQAHNEVKKMARTYEAFKDAEKVFAMLKEAKSIERELNQSIEQKKEVIAQWNAKIDEAEKNHESNVQKRKEYLEQMTKEAQDVRNSATVYREQEKAKANEWVANAKAEIDVVKQEVARLQAEAKEWQEKRDQAKVNYEKITQEIQSLKSRLG